MPYPSVNAMQAVVDPLVGAEPTLGKIDARNCICDRFLKKLESEGVHAEVDGTVMADVFLESRPIDHYYPPITIKLDICLKRESRDATDGKSEK
jgi:hypothetical protein